MSGITSNVNIFSRYAQKKPLKAAVKNGQVSNIDYSIYKEFRAVTKQCAFKHFPELFKKTAQKQKFILKGSVTAQMQKSGIVFRQVGENEKAFLLAESLKGFLDSVSGYVFKGSVKKSEPLPVYQLTDTYKNYFFSSRIKTQEALIMLYKDDYEVIPTGGAFTCPLSDSVKHTHSAERQMEHIEDESEIFEKLMAAVYLLNKLKPSGFARHLGVKFYSLSLSFREDHATNPQKKTDKSFIFARKSLLVELLGDIRNLMFLCKTCNTTKPKSGGWAEALKKDPFRTAVDRSLKAVLAQGAVYSLSRPIVRFDITTRMQKEVVEAFKDKEREHEVSNAKKLLVALAKKHGIALDALFKEIKDAP
ncbi:MAG: hypothetical protein ACI9BD_000866 [Candidatus Marinamargulisbacteria bacterium]